MRFKPTSAALYFHSDHPPQSLQIWSTFRIRLQVEWLRLTRSLPSPWAEMVSSSARINAQRGDWRSWTCTRNGTNWKRPHVRSHAYCHQISALPTMLHADWSLLAVFKNSVDRYFTLWPWAAWLVQPSRYNASSTRHSNDSKCCDLWSKNRHFFLTERKRWVAENRRKLVFHNRWMDRRQPAPCSSCTYSGTTFKHFPAHLWSSLANQCAGNFHRFHWFCSPTNSTLLRCGLPAETDTFCH